MCSEIYRPWGDLITIQGRGRGAEQGTITEPQEHTQDTGSPRKVRPSGHGDTGREWPMMRRGLKFTAWLKYQAPVGLAILHCSGLNAETTISCSFKAFHIILSTLCTENLILVCKFQTKATVCEATACEVLLSHLSRHSHDELMPASFPNMCSARDNLLSLFGFKHKVCVWLRYLDGSHEYHINSLLLPGTLGSSVARTV